MENIYPEEVSKGSPVGQNNCKLSSVYLGGQNQLIDAAEIWLQNADC